MHNNASDNSVNRCLEQNKQRVAALTNARLVSARIANVTFSGTSVRRIIQLYQTKHGGCHLHETQLQPWALNLSWFWWFVLYFNIIS